MAEGVSSASAFAPRAAAVSQCVTSSQYPALYPGASGALGRSRFHGDLVHATRLVV